jgi:hypothetical protein
MHRLRLWSQTNPAYPEPGTGDGLEPSGYVILGLREMLPALRLELAA